MIEKVVFMNMCMISDNKGNVLALDKVGKNYSGTTFPGGHVEADNAFRCAYGMSANYNRRSNPINCFSVDNKTVIEEITNEINGKEEE